MDTFWKGDVVVLGAGPAGACAAAKMAAAGLRVALLDRRAKGLAGAQWVNGVAARFFKAAQVEAPKTPELLGEAHPFVMLSPSGTRRLRVNDNPILEVDMRLLGQRMAGQAEAAQASLFWEHEVTRVELSPEGRIESLIVKRPSSSSVARIEATLFVDASGLAAVLRRQHPDLSWACAPVRPHDLCTAAQEVRKIKDRASARAFLALNQGLPGETLAWTGLEGGFSVLNVRIDTAMHEVSLLTGATAGRDGLSGKQMLDKFIARHNWVGDKIFGGARAIPLRRPYTQIVAPGLALLGDAACQVYGAHGSGIGISLVAARLLAEAVIEARARRQDLGALESLWPYASRFHREWGGLLGAADLLRRFSQRQTLPQMEALVDVLTPGMVRDGLAQRQARFNPRDVPKLLLGVLRQPRAVARLLPVLARMPLAALVASTYPSQHGSHTQVDLYRYEQRLQWLIDTV